MIQPCWELYSLKFSSFPHFVCSSACGYFTHGAITLYTPLSMVGRTVVKIRNDMDPESGLQPFLLELMLCCPLGKECEDLEQTRSCRVEGGCSEKNRDKISALRGKNRIKSNINVLFLL